MVLVDHGHHGRPDTPLRGSVADLFCRRGGTCARLVIRTKLVHSSSCVCEEDAATK